MDGPCTSRSRSNYVAATVSGTISLKLAPIGDTGRVISAPSCLASALTKRLPSRLLVIGSKPAGKPTPSSRTDTFLSARDTRTQIEPTERLGVLLGFPQGR